MHRTKISAGEFRIWNELSRVEVKLSGSSSRRTLIGSSPSKRRLIVRHTRALWQQLLTVVVYKDMKMGLLAEDTDHGTRELREIIKGMSAVLL